MGDPKTIEHDVALKAGQDVRDAVFRNLQLVDTPHGQLKVGLAAASQAFATAAGICAGVYGEGDDTAWIDALWKDVVRPLALSDRGHRAEFDAMLASLEAH
jgi:hypothetical protein